MSGIRSKTPLRKLALVALLAVSLAASQAVLTMLWSDSAFAKGGGNGGGNGGGGGKGGGNGGGGGGGGGNAGGNSGGSNAGGNANGPGSNNAGGNGKGKGVANGPPSDPGAPADAAANSALGLREAGVIRPLEDVYAVAEEQLKGRVLDAELVGSSVHGWNYDLRVVTEDGHVRRARYDAATLSLRALDGQPIE